MALVKRLCAAATVVALVGCTSAKITHLREGMTRDQVIDSLGDPDSARRVNQVEKFIYVNRTRWTFPEGGRANYQVTLVDGRVTNAGQVAPGHWLPLEGIRTPLRRIGIARIDSPPEPSFSVTKTKEAGEAAGLGALSGAAAGTGTVLSMARGKDSGLALLLIPPFLIGGAIVGAIVGATEAGAPSSETTRAIEAQLGDLIQHGALQEKMRGRILTSVRRLPDVTAAVVEMTGTPMAGCGQGLTPANGAVLDAIIEICVQTIGFSFAGDSSDPPLQLFGIVRVRLIEASDGREVFAKDLPFGGARRHFSDWKDDDSALMRRELDRGFDILAEMAVDEMFSAVSPQSNGARRDTDDD